MQKKIMWTPTLVGDMEPIDSLYSNESSLRGSFSESFGSPRQSIASVEISNILPSRNSIFSQESEPLFSVLLGSNTRKPRLSER